MKYKLRYHPFYNIDFIFTKENYGVNVGNIKAGNNDLATSAHSFVNNKRYYDEENNNNNKQDKGFDYIANNNNRQATLLLNPSPWPTLSIDNNVYVVWKDDTPGNIEVFFTANNDNGQTFSSPPDNLSNNAGDSDEPQISSTS